MKILEAIRASRKRLEGAREALEAREWEKEEEEWAKACREEDEEEELRRTAVWRARAEVWADGWELRQDQQAADAAAAACPSVNLL